jgi:hypothetical protein
LALRLNHRPSEAILVSNLMKEAIICTQRPSSSRAHLALLDDAQAVGDTLGQLGRSVTCDARGREQTS